MYMDEENKVEGAAPVEAEKVEDTADTVAPAAEAVEAEKVEGDDVAG